MQQRLLADLLFSFALSIAIAAAWMAGPASSFEAEQAGQIAMLCGDGTVAMALLDAAGNFDRLVTNDAFFDVVEDPVSMAGVLDASSWLFMRPIPR